FILGKMVGRCYQVLLLMLTALPPLAFFGVYAGVDLMRMVALAVATLVLIFALAAASLLASVLCRHTRDAVLSLYSLGVGLFVLSLVVHAVLDLAGGAGGPIAGPVWLQRVASGLEAFNPMRPLGNDWLTATVGETMQRLWA